MNRFPRTRALLVLTATASLIAGCGGAGSKFNTARSDVAGAQAAATSAEAAIAALASKLAALTSATPVAPAPATSAAATPSASPAATTGGLPVVPSGAALSSLLTPSTMPTTTPAAAPSGNFAGALASAKALLGGALSSLDVSKLCAAIPAAQVQALVKAPIGNPRPLPEICAWTGTNLQVSLTLNDPDMSNYKDLTGTGDHPISGLGDVAVWSEPVPGATLPDINAHKGKVTCYVQSSDVPLSTIAYTGKDPFFKITDAASQAYAALEEKLCADIFSVTG